VAEASTMAPPKMATPKPGPGPAGSIELTGKTVSHFEVGAVLAKGRNGVVYKARDTKENRDVALKILWPEISKIDDEMQRFIRAIKTMRPLSTRTSWKFMAPARPGSIAGRPWSLSTARVSPR